MSTENAEKIIQRIKDLPPLPLVVQRLLAIVDDGRSSARDVTRVLSTDQALAAKVLKLVNSSFYGFSKEISTITRAVVILGFSAVRNLALGLATVDALKAVHGPVDWDGFWNHSLATAASAQAFANHTNYPEPEEAFIAGLLHDIGHFVIGITLPQEYDRILSENTGDLLECEIDGIGITHIEVGIRLLEHWKLPEALCRVARFHHNLGSAKPDKDPLLGLVMLADVLACVRGDPYVEKGDAEAFLELVDRWNLSLNECGDILIEADRHVTDARAFLHIRSQPIPFSSLIAAPSLGECRVAVISSDADRSQWITKVLEYHGCEIVDAKDVYRLDPDNENLRLALIDAGGVEDQPAGRLASRLAECGVHVIVVDKDGEECAENTALHGFPHTGIVLTRQSLEACIAS